VWAARRVGRRVVEEGLSGWTPDVLIERHALFSDAGWKASTRLGVPWVLEVNAPLVAERERFETVLRPEWARGWERDVLQAAPAIAAVSRWLVRWLRQEVGCRNVTWVPNGVMPMVGDRNRGRAALGLSPDEPVLGFVGSFKPWHGVGRLGPVATAVGARLVLVGAGPQEVEGIAASRVVRAGHLHGQAFADAVAALDVGLAPYPADAPPWFCPLKIFDYRAQGVPVVTTDVGDSPLLVKGGGLSVPAADVDAMVDAVRQCLGQRPTPRVRSWESVARDVVALARR
jgi:glycosyltransferase involved in cell wall biosynthesis